MQYNKSHVLRIKSVLNFNPMCVCCESSLQNTVVPMRSLYRWEKVTLASACGIREWRGKPGRTPESQGKWKEKTK